MNYDARSTIYDIRLTWNVLRRTYVVSAHCWSYTVTAFALVWCVVILHIVIDYLYKDKPIEEFHDPVVLKNEIILVEDMMYKYAKNLEFEEAAAYRDRVAELKEKLIMT